jgi:hypothetical protein
MLALRGLRSSSWRRRGLSRSLILFTRDMIMLNTTLSSKKYKNISTIP